MISLGASVALTGSFRGLSHIVARAASPLPHSLAHRKAQLPYAQSCVSFGRDAVRAYAVSSKDASEAKVDIKKVVAVLYKAGQAAKEPRLLGCVENALGLRQFLKQQGVEFVVTADKEGPDSELDRHLPDADVVITTPFHPAYLTADRLSKAKKLKLALTAGVGSDHVDLQAAAEAGITVAEVTGSNVVSVAEHVVMQILILVRNFVPAYKQVVDGKWDIAAVAAQAYDLEGKTVGTVGAGRIGQRVLQRLQGFGCAELLYHDYARLSMARESALNARFMPLNELVQKCDIVTINCPLHPATEHLFNRELIGQMKPGSYLVNTARGKIVETEAVVEALKSGHLAGYAGDVWYPQPAPPDHPWRHMPNHAMTPHYSGTTLDAQARYAAGVRHILELFLQGLPLEPEDVIVLGGKLAAQYDKTATGHSLEHREGWEKLKDKANKDP